ncbi:MAG: PEGA domain-containing protein [Ignavibacteriaceae bacterium]|nr:PEGA domain-containing protein [Ignavibacteriaceae bacterium]HRN25802.1 PEGA domain-containing protein [Ignavibacteriaceae bacterium]HRP93962.1 PEGA domain-containing protein [Ignavibacteriaceae bacterium]HRQ53491.1 PEGA domain-containing protein [Ignavibacteriaceae bacterium]
MKKLFYILSVAVLLLVFNACSTILNTTTQQVELISNPPNANIMVDGQKFGTSPQKINIERGANHVVTFELDGFDIYETQLTRKISFWFWGNALNGFIPGMTIDLFTGSLYNIMPEKLEVELSPAKVETNKKKR